MTDSLTASSSPEIREAAEFFKQWRVLNLDGQQGGDIRPGQRYLLKNNTNRHFLQYKKQDWGIINLGFSDDADPSTASKVVQWEFVNAQRTPVKYDEPVAIRCNEDYVREGHRVRGADLVWSDNAVHEWRLLGGRRGAPVKTGDSFCIFNMHNGEPLIYFKREFGGNIGWPSSKTLLEQGIDWGKEAAQKAVVEYLKSQGGGGSK